MLDVSMWQGDIDWAKVYADGYRTAGMKATEGNGFLDTKFAQNWAGSKAAGLKRIAYGFGRPDLGPPKPEVDYLRSVVGTLDPADRIALDLETGNGDLSGWAQEWLDYAATFGITPLLYSALWFMTPHGLLAPGLAKYPLWLAAYQSTLPTPPWPWTSIAVWQSGSTGSVSGIAGNVDLDEDYHSSVLDDWVAASIGQCIDLDHMYGCQCVDLVDSWANYIGRPLPAVPGGAKDLVQKIADYQWINNTPTNFPDPGDIIVWGTTIGPWGHTAVCLRADVNYLNSIDQNWVNTSDNGSPAAYVRHDYRGVLGWQHPLIPIITPIQEDAPMTPQEKADFDTLVATVKDLASWKNNVAGPNISKINSRLGAIADGIKADGFVAT